MEHPQTATRFRRAISEFFLIVAGVSVALGAEALWGVRLDRVREAEYLEQIRSDLVENERRLSDAIADDQLTATSVQSAIDAVVDRRPIAPDSAQAWLHDRRGLSYADPRLLTGTFSALVGTGDLRLIRDGSIRQGLIAYLPKVERDLAEYDRWVSLSVPHIESLRILGLEASPPGTRPTFPADFALTLAADQPEVLAALHGLLQKQRNRLIYLERLLETTQGLSEQLAAAR